MLDELCMSFEINADRMKNKAWKCLAMELLTVLRDAFKECLYIYIWFLLASGTYTTNCAA